LRRLRVRAGPRAESLVTIAAIQAVFDNFRGKPTDTLVLLALADRADRDNWECYPSIADTAARTNLCERAVQASLKRLQEDGAIECIRYGGVAGSRGGMPTNRYRIVRSFLLGDGAADAPSDSAGAAPWDSAGAAPSAVPRCISRPAMVQLTLLDGAGAAPEPRDEPSKDLRATVGGAICPACDGTGRDPDQATCQVCSGSGVNPDLRIQKRGR
jgi:hypothetical protein